MNPTIKKTVGQLVTEDYRAAQVFKAHKIDFCCKGNRTLQEVATKKGLDLGALITELECIQNDNPDDQIDFKTWPLDLLADYIEKKHHRYVERQIPILRQYLNKLCHVHGQKHPELYGIFEHFNASAGELAMHMKKEELVLFPFIRKMVQGQSGGEQLEQPGFGTVQNPIRMMMEEHDHEGERFRKIAALSNDYTPPSDACNTYRVTYALLQEFENDLHRHIHLENNILFPSSEKLEKKVCHG